MKKLVKLLVFVFLLYGGFLRCQNQNMEEATGTIAPEQSKIVSLTHVADVSLPDLQAMATAFGD